MAPELMIVKNNPNVSHWSLEDGYDEGVREDDYPVRVFNAKQAAVLVTYPRLFEKDLEYLCRGSLQGFKILLSSPGEELKMNRHYFRVPLLEEVDVMVRAKLMTTSDQLRGYTPSQRKCFFGSERRLRFYKFYTLHSCEAECLSNFTQQECGCVKFSMPSIDITIVKKMKFPNSFMQEKKVQKFVVLRVQNAIKMPQRDFMERM